MIKFDFQTYTKNFIEENDKLKYQSKINEIEERFLHGDLNYWMHLESFISPLEVEQILQVIKTIRDNSDIFIVIGIGGSYMGSKAVIDALSKTYQNDGPEIIFLGTGLTAEEYNEAFEHIKGKRISVNVISKSGTTLEPSIAFDYLLDYCKKVYSEEELKQRIFITTDKEEGTLRKIADEKGYVSFVVPRNIGGRFSVLTPVGLLPIAVSGIDIQKLLKGAEYGFSYFKEAMTYALVRDILYQKGKLVESYTIYNKKLIYFTEWLKQLFAETQGKKKKAILPISNVNTRDLHSLGQFLQEGTPILFETVLGIEKEKDVPLNLYPYSLHELNKIALEKVAIAHEKGSVPSILFSMDEKNETSMGELIIFFIHSAIIGALLLEVNPFDQPGVQEYKSLINDAISQK